MDKITEPGHEESCEKPELYRIHVCTLLDPSRKRPALQSVVRWTCKRLKNPDRRGWRQLVKAVRYVKGSTDLATFMPRGGDLDKIEQSFLDGDWRCDDFDRKSVSCGHLLAGGCGLHFQDLTTNQVSGQSEITAMSEHWKVAKQLQHNLKLCGCGRIEIGIAYGCGCCRAVCSGASCRKSGACGREALAC